MSKWILPLLMISSQAMATPQLTWEGTVSNDLNDPNNWQPHAVPSAPDSAVFDSTITNQTNPTATNTHFTAFNLEFLNSAQAFTFNFNNCTFTSVAGIVGSMTNTTLLSQNLNNSSPLAEQFLFTGVATSGNAIINGANIGTLTGFGSAAQISFLTDSQFAAQSTYSMGNGGQLFMSNSGTSTSALEDGGNQIGYITNDQIRFANTLNVGNNVSIQAQNSGTHTGNNVNVSDFIGFVGAYQCNFATVNAGNFFNLNLTNTGNDSSTGTGGNQVGYIGLSQAFVGSTFTAGDNATIAISNSGTNTSGSGGSKTGFISRSQFEVGSAFQAGKNLSLMVTNDAPSKGASTQVGWIGSHQINFNNTCTFGDGTVISAFNKNSGTVNGDQIHFAQGFNLTSGKATIQASNQGTVTGHGIYIGAGTGGDVNIVLNNASLDIDSFIFVPYVIGALNGDSTSTVISRPFFLNINTDTGVNANFAGNIQGIVNLLKSGLGTQTLSGTNTSLGTLNVNDGILILNGTWSGGGSIAGGVNGATLAGTGTFLGLVQTLNPFGKISPGATSSSIGTLNFLAGFTNNDGEYDVNVNGAGQSDLIHVVGGATLNGGLVQVSSSDGTYKFQSPYTILNATTRTGTFTGATAVSPLIKSVLSYDAQHVYLTLTTDISSVAVTHNQRAVAQQLDGIVGPNAQQNLLLSQIADLPTNDAQEALTDLSGYQHTSDLLSTQIINRQFIRRLYDPLRSIVTTEPCCECACECECNINPWLDVGGTFIQVDGNREAHGFHSNGYNFTAGVQSTFSEDWTLGVAGEYDRSMLHFRQSSGRENCNTWLVGVYGLYRPSCYYGLVDFAYGYSNNKLKREVEAIEDHASSHPKVRQYTFYGEVGFDINSWDMLIQPFFGIETGTFRRNHVKEHSEEGIELSVHKRKRNLSYSRLGLHLTRTQCDFNVSVDVAWNACLNKFHNRVDERFVEFGSTFDVRGINFRRSSVDYAVTVSSDLCNLCNAYIEASGETWKEANVVNIIGGIEYCW